MYFCICWHQIKVKYSRTSSQSQNKAVVQSKSGSCHVPHGFGHLLRQCTSVTHYDPSIKLMRHYRTGSVVFMSHVSLQEFGNKLKVGWVQRVQPTGSVTIIAPLKFYDILRLGSTYQVCFCALYFKRTGCRCKLQP